MFKELLPLLATRSVILTAGTVQDDVIRVTVTPRPKSKDEAKEVTQPFIVEGTAEELDSELPKALVEYTGQMLNHERALEQVKSNMDKALAEAKAEADKKIAEAKNKSKSTTTSKTPATKTTEKPEPQKEAAPPSLFDAPATPAVEPNPAPAPVAATTEPDHEDDDDDPNDAGDSEGSDESEESGSDASEQPAPEVASVPAAAASATAQPIMFNPRFDEEQAILEEAFNGAENDLIAA